MSLHYPPTEDEELYYRNIELAGVAAELLLHLDEDTMKLGDMIESKYLKQSDVDGEVLATVRSIKKANVARDDEEPDYKWTVSFDEMKKPMVLNVTNIKRMGKALGDDTDDWVGKQVVLFVDPDIEFGGSVVGGLRIRAARHPAAKARGALSPDEVNRKLRDVPDSDVPF